MGLFDLHLTGILQAGGTNLTTRISHGNEQTPGLEGKNLPDFSTDEEMTENQIGMDRDEIEEQITMLEEQMYALEDKRDQYLEIMEEIGDENSPRYKFYAAKVQGLESDIGDIKEQITRLENRENVKSEAKQEQNDGFKLEDFGEPISSTSGSDASSGQDFDGEEEAQNGWNFFMPEGSDFARDEEVDPNKIRFME